MTKNGIEWQPIFMSFHSNDDFFFVFEENNDQIKKFSWNGTHAYAAKDEKKNE